MLLAGASLDVRLAGSVGEPLSPGVVEWGEEALAADIKDHVKSEVAAHEYPREIEFREELPKTATGKIRRTELQDHAEAEAETEGGVGDDE